MAGSAILTAIPICCESGSMHLLKCITYYIGFLVTIHKGVAEIISFASQTYNMFTKLVVHCMLDFCKLTRQWEVISDKLRVMYV
jgi:hypothetical protein